MKTQDLLNSLTLNEYITNYQNNKRLNKQLLIKYPNIFTSKNIPFIKDNEPYKRNISK